jgi:hypothetical protein
MREVVIRGLDQKRLKVAVYGPFPVEMDRRTAALH